MDVVGRPEGLSQPPREAVRLLLVVMSCHQVISLLDSMLPTFHRQVAPHKYHIFNA